MNWEEELNNRIEKIKELRELCKDYPDQVQREQARIDEIKLMIPYISSLLKKQREICAEIYMQPLPSDNLEPNEVRVWNDNRMIKILNAPEPSGAAK